MHRALLLAVIGFFAALPLTAAAPAGWGDDVRISAAPGLSQHPSIAIDAAGNAHVAWADDRDDPDNPEVFYRKLAADGTPLTGELQLTDTPGIPNMAWYPAVAVDQQGNVHVAYASNEGGEYVDFNIYYTKLGTNGNMLIDAKQITFTLDFSFNPSITVDQAGNAHIVYSESDGEIYYTKLSPGGTTLVDNLRLTFSAQSSERPDVAVDQQGNLHVAYQDETTGLWQMFYTKLDNNGNTLVDDTMISGPSSTAKNGEITVDAAGNSHIVWMDMRDGNYEIYYSKLGPSGATLVDDLRLTNDDSYSGDPTIGVGADGNVHVAWFDQLDSDQHPYNIYYALLDNGGTVLASGVQLTFNLPGPPPNDAAYPSLAVDSSGNPRVAWHDRRDWDGVGYQPNDEIYYKRALPPQPQRPVLLVHGLFVDPVEDPATWAFMKDRLQDDSFQVFISDYAPGNCGLFTPSGCAAGDIKGYAATLLTEVNAVKQQTGAAKVDIVAHSMGGLVSRWYLQKLGGSANVQTFITLGTPHDGSEVAYYEDLLCVLFPLTCSIPWTAVDQMTPGSSFLDSLNTAAFPGTDGFYTVAGTAGFTGPFSQLTSLILPGPDDGMVSFASAHHPLAAGTATFPLNHSALPQSETVYQQVKVLLLGLMPPSPPQPLSAATDAEGLPLLQGMLQPGQAAIHTLTMLPAQQAWIAATGGAVLSLTAPSGTSITPATGDPAVTYVNDSVSSGYHLTAPEAGNWTVTLDGAGLAEPLTYAIRAFADSDLDFIVSLNTAVASPGQPVLISATLQAMSPVSGTVAAVITTPANATVPVSLYDDGLHGDGLAGDGTFAATFAGTTVPGSYGVLASSIGQLDQQPYDIEKPSLFTAEHFPDLAISTVAASDVWPKPQELVFLTTTVTNLGTATAKNAAIQFFDGQPAAGGTLLGQVTLTFPPGVPIPVSLPWIATPGMHTIVVLPSPGNAFLDADYGNEQASVVVKVCATTRGTFPGGILSGSGGCLNTPLVPLP
ncbi:MAG: alpha/beta fold hydrolase [Candidatus Aenigmarchaeota archaeon]|nr:alpha/beta fold hydrolase [Candidatus Aenigmarchaeota archaeon]